MKLLLSPQLNSNSVTYTRQGDTLKINGESIDLSGDWAVLEPSSEGGLLHPSGLLLSGERVGEEITLTVLAPHSANAPEAERFPVPITLADGERVTFPREVDDA